MEGSFLADALAFESLGLSIIYLNSLHVFYRLKRTEVKKVDSCHCNRWDREELKAALMI